MKISEYQFTYEDFKDGKVFEYITGITGWKQSVVEGELEAFARDVVKFPNFKKALAAYKKDLKAQSLSIIRDDGISDFGDQKIDLNTGEWTADESGVWRYGNQGNVV
jgi:hypothetical protein